jgi:hypothetical protein
MASVTVPSTNQSEDALNISAPLLLRPSAPSLLSTSAPLPVAVSPRRNLWLFSARTDLSVFLGSAVVSLVALWIGARAGVLYGETPDWAWVPAVLLIDVAHVWSTSFRVYLDKDELQRRPWLYTLVPVLGLAIGVALYSEGELVFWRVLAYLAVFHFIRQQYGWVALYRARAGERDALGKCIDVVAVYSATLYPLIYWHTHLPRKFWWFLANDFTHVPAMIARIAAPIYWLALGVYASKSLYGWLVKREGNPGKDIVIVTTAVCWYVGIVGLNSDYAFTVTNVVIHGVPYFALIYWYSRTRMKQTGGRGVYRRDVLGPGSLARPKLAVRFSLGDWGFEVNPGAFACAAAARALRARRIHLASQEQSGFCARANSRLMSREYLLPGALNRCASDFRGYPPRKRLCEKFVVPPSGGSL